MRSKRSVTKPPLFVVLCLALTFFVLYSRILSSSSFTGGVKRTFATLITNDNYLIGAKVLGQSLKDADSTLSFVVMVTDKVSFAARKELEELNFLVFSIGYIPNPNKTHLDSENARWLDTYTKLRVWNLIEFDKVVFLDADSVVLKNIDDLFSLDTFGAVYECCDKFNSGLLVVQPNEMVFNDMIDKIAEITSYDGADQGFLNEYFAGKWLQLSFNYNAMESASPSTAWDMERIKVVHFNQNKPWKYPPDSHLLSPHSATLNKLWWFHYKNLPISHQTLLTNV